MSERDGKDGRGRRNDEGGGRMEGKRRAGLTGFRGAGWRQAREGEGEAGKGWRRKEFKRMEGKR